MCVSVQMNGWHCECMYNVRLVYVIPTATCCEVMWFMLDSICQAPRFADTLMVKSVSSTTADRRKRRRSKGHHGLCAAHPHLDFDRSVCPIVSALTATLLSIAHHDEHVFTSPSLKQRCNLASLDFRRTGLAFPSFHHLEFL